MAIDVPTHINETIHIDENKKAFEKLDILWNGILATEYSGLPEIEGPGYSGMFSLLCSSYLEKAFTHNGYVMETGRRKVIHESGSIIKVTFVPSPRSHAYTGIFNSGASSALLRLSVAVPPQDNKKIYGMALMFFRDHEPSSSIMAMHSLDGQKEYNIFAHDFVTSVPAPECSFKNWVLDKSFSAGIESLDNIPLNARSLSLDEIALITQEGHKVKNPFAPYMLIFRPTAEAKALFKGVNDDSDFREVLNKQGQGLKIYFVLAKDHKTGEEIYLGEIFAKSNFINSSFSDKHLFFKHPKPNPFG